MEKLAHKSETQKKKVTLVYMQLMPVTDNELQNLNKCQRNVDIREKNEFLSTSKRENNSKAHNLQKRIINVKLLMMRLLVKLKCTVHLFY